MRWINSMINLIRQVGQMTKSVYILTLVCVNYDDWITVLPAQLEMSFSSHFLIKITRFQVFQQCHLFALCVWEMLVRGFKIATFKNHVQGSCRKPQKVGENFDWECAKIPKTSLGVLNFANEPELSIWVGKKTRKSHVMANVFANVSVQSWAYGSFSLFISRTDPPVDRNSTQNFMKSGKFVKKTRQFYFAFLPKNHVNFPALLSWSHQGQFLNTFASGFGMLTNLWRLQTASKYGFVSVRKPSRKRSRNW